MIRKIEIQNYRSCIDTSFELHPNLSVLIGPNSSGKTNILNALLILRQLAEGYRYHQEDEEPTRECKLKVGFDVDDKETTLSATVNIFTDESNDDVVFSSRQLWDMQDFTGNRKKIELPLWLAREFDSSEERRFFIRPARRISIKYYDVIKKTSKLPASVRKPITNIAKDMSEMRYYGASQFVNPANCPVSFEIERVGESSRAVGLRGHAKFLSDLYHSYHSKNNESYEQFFEIIGPKGIGLIDDIYFRQMPTSSIDYYVKVGGDVAQRKREKILVIPQFQIRENVLSPNQLSEGTLKTITLLFYLITETGKVLLIEEPEVCVHHGLLSSIIGLIKTYSSDKQIVVTTHSDFVLDEVKPDNVYIVTNVLEEGTKVSHITKAMSRAEILALRDYLEKEGNLGEYWRHGGFD